MSLLFNEGFSIYKINYYQFNIHKVTEFCSEFFKYHSLRKIDVTNFTIKNYYENKSKI